MTFETLEAAIADEHFPEVDLMLRRGRHIGRDDGTAYDYLVETEAILEARPRGVPSAGRSLLPSDSPAARG